MIRRLYWVKKVTSSRHCLEQTNARNFLPYLGKRGVYCQIVSFTHKKEKKRGKNNQGGHSELVNFAKCWNAILHVVLSEVARFFSCWCHKLDRNHQPFFQLAGIALLLALLIIYIKGNLVVSCSIILFGIFNSCMWICPAYLWVSMQVLELP